MDYKIKYFVNYELLLQIYRQFLLRKILFVNLFSYFTSHPLCALLPLLLPAGLQKVSGILNNRFYLSQLIKSRFSYIMYPLFCIYTMSICHLIYLFVINILLHFKIRRHKLNLHYNLYLLSFAIYFKVNIT